MKPHQREKFLNLVGLALLGVCFVLSLGRIVARSFRREDTSNLQTIRFAHWQLESGIREAFDKLAADYMALHPDVRVVQMPVPENIYANWLRTQLIGGTAPELIETDTGHGETNEILANYFEPITPYLSQVNPYNKDNALARTPWRETFVDGLSHAYNQELLQNFSIPNSMFTIRMFYNRPLWRAIFGSETPPRTYDELMACCRRAAAYRAADGQSVVPIAGSGSNVPFLIQRFFSSQTQRLFYSLARPGQLYPPNEDLVLDFLAHRWTFDTPAVRDGLELARGVGQFLPPGFLQLKREDTLFIFSQGRALMTVTGSWDAPSMRSQAPFEIGVFTIPVPGRDDPHYGPNTVGPVSEAGWGTALGFNVSKQPSAEKQARVIDFLHFLSSQESNRKFSDYSGWLPAVVGVQPSPLVQPFVAHLDGYPAGFSMGVVQGDAGSSLGTESTQVQNTNMYRLFDPDGGPEDYVRATAEPMRRALIADLNTINRSQLEVVVRQDTTLAAIGALGREHPDEWAAKVSELDELQTQEEISVAARRWKFGQVGVVLEK